MLLCVLLQDSTLANSQDYSNEVSSLLGGPAGDQRGVQMFGGGGGGTFHSQPPTPGPLESATFSYPVPGVAPAQQQHNNNNQSQHSSYRNTPIPPVII